MSFVPTVLASPRALWVNLLVPTRATTFSPTDCIVVDAEKHASPVKFVPMVLVRHLVRRARPTVVGLVSIWSQTALTVEDVESPVALGKFVPTRSVWSPV